MTKYGDVILKDLTSHEMMMFVVPIVAIYKHPLDYPNKYVGRIWNINHPSRFLIVADTYEELLEKKPTWMTKLPRNTSDDPCVIESWI